ncbi:MAG TPA: ester cyclase [Thermoanaerobaculia bacterium]|nr:ester cyclase [Thermoanaerobaculia bacterium]
MHARSDGGGSRKCGTRVAILSALPDVRLEIEDILSSPDGKRAAVRWHAYGTHGGEGFGLKATNRNIDVRGTTWLVVEDGKVVEGWDTWNLNGLSALLQ